MQFSTRFLMATAIVLTAASSAIHDDLYKLGGAQQQLPIGEIALETLTRVVTESQTFIEVVETLYMTRPQILPTWVPVALVKVENSCDESKEVGCAVCRTIHERAEFEDEW